MSIVWMVYGIRVVPTTLRSRGEGTLVNVCVFLWTRSFRLRRSVRANPSNRMGPMTKVPMRTISYWANELCFPGRVWLDNRTNSLMMTLLLAARLCMSTVYASLSLLLTIRHPSVRPAR